MPRVSFRWILALMTFSALLAAVARAAGEGGAFAVAAMFAVGFVVVCLLLFILLFLFCWAIALVWYDRDAETAKGSPFSEGQLPPQILPPREQSS